MHSYEAEHIRVLANGVVQLFNAKSLVRLEDLEETLGLEVYRTLINDFDTVITSISAGQPLVLKGSSRYAKELKAMVAARRDDFSRNLVERLLAYALCRRLEGYDELVVDGLMQDIAADGYRMQSLICAVVTSYPFTHRRVEEDSRKERKSNE